MYICPAVIGLFQQEDWELQSSLCIIWNNERFNYRRKGKLFRLTYVSIRTMNSFITEEKSGMWP